MTCAPTYATACPPGLGEIAILGSMALASRLLAAGPDWRVTEVVCTSGPGDRRFLEQHDSVSIALVTQGSFQYRTAEGAATMAPGSLLLGNAGSCFECGHEHGRGDRCLAFHYTPGLFESIIAASPGVRTCHFPAPRLPSLSSLIAVTASIEALRDGGGTMEEFHELAIRLASQVATTLSKPTRSRRCPTARDERRVTRALRRIEAAGGSRLTVRELAAEAAVSLYHFVRIFEHTVGVPPGQYMLRRRLRFAAVRLRSGDDPIGAVALSAGFEDLSTFNRQFRAATGFCPSAYRTLRGTEGVRGQP